MINLRSINMALLLLAALVPPLATSATPRERLASTLQRTNIITPPTLHHSSDHALGLPDDDNPLALSGQSRKLLHGFHFPWLYPRCPRCQFCGCSRSGLFFIGHCWYPVPVGPFSFVVRTFHCFGWRWPWFIPVRTLASAAEDGPSISPPAPGAPPNDPPSTPADAVFDIPVAAAAAGEDGDSAESDTGSVRGAACFTDNDCALPEDAFAPLDGTAPLATDGIVTASCVRMGLEGALSNDEPGICLCLYPEGGDDGEDFLDVCVQVPVVAAAAAASDGPFDAAAAGPPPLRTCSVNTAQTSESESGVLLSSDYFPSESVYEYDDVDPESYGYEYVDGEFQQVDPGDPPPFDPNNNGYDPPPFDPYNGGFDPPPFDPYSGGYDPPPYDPYSGGYTYR